MNFFCTKIKTQLSVILFLTSTFVANAQENSPYSRYGIGDLKNTTQLALQAMGGANQAFAHYNLINFNNPASYSMIKLTTFDVAANAFGKTITDPAQVKYKSGNGGLAYLQMAFPVSKFAGLGFGMAPLSNIGYKIATLDSLQNVSKVVHQYEGNGGFNQLNLGTGFNYKWLRVGANMLYVFGKRNIRNISTYPDSLTILGSEHIRAYEGNGLGYQIGAQLQFDSLGKTNFYVALGGTYKNGIKLNGTQEYAFRTIRGNGIFSTDQGNLNIEYTDLAGYIKLPSQINMGLRVGVPEKWSILCDYETNNWNKYQFFDVKDSVTSNSYLKIGGEFSPQKAGNLKLWNRSTYRLGMLYGKDYINLRQTTFPTFAITAGATLPVNKRSLSKLHTVLEFGQRGTLNNNLFKENYFKFSLGFTLSEKWFLKRKYD